MSSTSANDSYMRFQQQMRRMSELHLYVWRGIWSDDTDGLACALAHSVDEARALIIAGMGYGPEDTWITGQLYADEPEVHDEPYGFGVQGGG